MEKANRVTAYLKVTAEFYDPDATPETVRACVEQDLEDAGYEVDVENCSSGYMVNEPATVIFEEKPKWIPVKDRLPDAAGVPVLVTAVNAYGQRHVFEAFQGYGDFKWYTYDITKMKRDGSTNNEVGNGWAITHWMAKPEPPEE